MATRPKQGVVVQYLDDAGEHHGEARVAVIDAEAKRYSALVALSVLHLRHPEARALTMQIARALDGMANPLHIAVASIDCARVACEELRRSPAIRRMSPRKGNEERRSRIRRASDRKGVARRVLDGIEEYEAERQVVAL